MSSVETPLAGRLRELITSGLAQPYTSHSGFDGTATGNHYQSIDLGNEATAGFRGDRAAVLDCIDFRARKVLDLGSNLGEMSRAARVRGARLVDGIEYDPFFVELAQLITAHNGQSRVSFRQGDITDATIYGERYDVVLALSVFHYVSRVLDQLAQITDVLVIETHMLHGNFDGGYLAPIQKRFPAMRVLGQTDWGQMGDGSETRLVMAFAKDRQSLNEILVAPHAWSQPSSFPQPTQTQCLVDAEASNVHRGFFEAWDYDSTEELLAAVGSTEIALEALASNRNIARHGYSGWIYWFLYLKGWLDYHESGNAGAGNIYFDYMTSHYIPDGADTALGQAMRDPEKAESIVRHRFADLDRFREAEGADVSAEIDPIRAVIGHTPPANPLKLVDAANGESIPARRLDGWHRLFGARALGAGRLRAEVVTESRNLPLLRGDMQAFAVEDGELEIVGWCFDLEGSLDAIELRLGGETVALTPPEQRDDVAAAFADLPQAGRSGFSMRPALPRDWQGEALRFELLGMRDWLPVGRLRLDYEPGMLGQPLPAAEVLERTHGVGDPTRLALKTALAANSLLDSVSHYRALETFRDVVHWGAGSGLLLRLAARRLPEASLRGVEGDAELREWANNLDGGPQLVASEALPATPLEDRAADLVLRDRPLAELSRAELDAWLRELLRLLRPGGYAALVGGWPAEERAEMIRACGDRLDVVSAAAASTWRGGDVILLRRP
jgi:SAM-dependent methyltransferase